MLFLTTLGLSVPGQVGRLWAIPDLFKEAYVAVIATVVKTADTAYMLFLIKTERGFEPASGRTFPTESVFELRRQRRLGAPR